MAELTGLKTKFQREAEATGTFEDIAQVASIQPPNLEADEVEIEELDGDGFMRSLPGLIDPGEVSLTVNFDPENEGHTKFYDDLLAQQLRKYRILFPGDYGWTFTGWVKSYAPTDIEGSAIMQAEVTIRVTGAATLGPITTGAGA